MQDTKKIVENPDFLSPKRADREVDLKNWNEDQGRRNAKEEGVEMTDAHWKIIYFLRDYYLEHGPVENGREFSDALNNQFVDKGGRKYLRQLFPQGPVG